MARNAVPARPKRILLVRLSSLGDVVCTLPLAVELRRLFPDARLAWAVEPDAAPLLRHHAATPEPYPVPRTGGATVRARAVAGLRAFGADLVVDVQGNAKSGTVARLAARGAPILGFAREDVREWANLALTTVKAPPSGAIHAVRRNLGLLRAFGVEPPDGPPDYGFVTDAEERAAGRAALRAAGVADGTPVALLHPGKLRDVRTWSGAGYADLARRLRGRGYACVLEGPDPRRPLHDADALRRCIEAGDATDLGPALPLRALAGLLDDLSTERRERGIPHVLVSPDTLLPHLAAACGLPVVLLAGPQDPARTGPLGVETRVVKARETLPCAPCRKRRCHIDEDRACMLRITPEAVEAAVVDL